MDVAGVIVFVVLFGLIAWALLRTKPGPVRVCAVCGHHGPTVRRTRGSMGVEVLAWLLLLIPGVIYSLWRLTTRQVVCSECGSEQVIPVTSPAGRRLVQDAQASRPPAS